MLIKKLMDFFLTNKGRTAAKPRYYYKAVVLKLTTEIFLLTKKSDLGCRPFLGEFNVSYFQEQGVL